MVRRHLLHHGLLINSRLQYHGALVHGAHSHHAAAATATATAAATAAAAAAAAAALELCGSEQGSSPDHRTRTRRSNTRCAGCQHPRGGIARGWGHGRTNPNEPQREEREVWPEKPTTLLLNASVTCDDSRARGERRKERFKEEMRECGRQRGGICRMYLRTPSSRASPTA